MKLLLNDKEIAHFLNYNMILRDKLDHIKFTHKNLSQVIVDHKDKMSSKKVNGKPAKEYYNDEQKKKFYDKIRKSVVRDLDEWKDELKEFLLRKKEYNFHKIHKNIDAILDNLGVDYVFDMYKNSEYKNFVKGT